MKLIFLMYLTIKERKGKKKEGRKERKKISVHEMST